MIRLIPKKIENIMIKQYDKDNVQQKRTKFYSYLTKVKVNKTYFLPTPHTFPS